MMNNENKVQTIENLFSIIKPSFRKEFNNNSYTVEGDVERDKVRIMV